MSVATPEPSMPSRLSRRPPVAMIRCLVSCLCSFAYRTMCSSIAAAACAPDTAVAKSVCRVGKESSEVDPPGLQFRVVGLGDPAVGDVQPVPANRGRGGRGETLRAGQNGLVGAVRVDHHDPVRTVLRGGAVLRCEHHVGPGSEEAESVDVGQAARDNADRTGPAGAADRYPQQGSLIEVADPQSTVVEPKPVGT